MILIRSLSTLYRRFILRRFSECLTADSITGIDAADGRSRNESEKAETSVRLLGPTISAIRLAEFSISARKHLLNPSTVSPLVVDCLGFLGSTLFAFALAAAITQVGYAVPVALQSCSVPALKRSVRCGTIEVLRIRTGQGPANWLDRTFAASEADAKCQSAFPQMRDEFSRIMERLASGRVLVKAPGREGIVVLNPESG
jgi:hypothetical protein